MDFVGDALSWRHVGPAIEVELHRAPLNEIGTTTLAELEVLVEYLREGAGGARALIWWSSRPGFCAGADLRELHAGLMARQERQVALARRVIRALGPASQIASRGLRRVTKPLVRREISAFIERIHAVMDALDTASIPTIAAVHGVVFGGGFELALTADHIVAERSARFCFPELRLGIVPGFGGVPRLQRDVGNALVRDLLLTGRSLNAARAQEVGLVARVVPKGEGLAAARRIAEQSSKFDAAVVARAKAFLKPLPAAALARERALFCDMVTQPRVVEALERFVNDASTAPYLP